jgi:outer membrane protein assembly factor BamB
LIGLWWSAALPVFAADWPQWRGPNRDGIGKDTGLLKTWPQGGPKVLWTFEKAGAGFGCPVVVGDKLFVLGADDAEKGDKEFALCLNVKDGSEVWRKPLDTSSGGYSYYWGSGPRSTPAVDGDHIYVLGAKGDLQCLKIADGTKVWAISMAKDLGGNIPGWGYSESPLIDGDHLICTPGGGKGTIAKLNKKDGSVVWRSLDLKEGAQYSSLVISNFGVKQYITLLSAGAVSVRASDGKLLWRSKAGANDTAVIPTAIVDDKYVFAFSNYNSSCGLLELTADGTDSVKMKEVYTNKALINMCGGAVLVGDHLYGHHARGWVCLEFKKLDKDDDKPVSESRKIGGGSIIHADGRFYCFNESDGSCTLVDANPKEWKECGTLQLPKKSQLPRRGGHIWTHPIIANGKLFLRDHEMLSCFDIK